MTEGTHTSYGIENHGLLNLRTVHWNLNTAQLVEDIIKNGEGHLVHLGPVVVRTGAHTGRAAKDKIIVEEPTYLGALQAWNAYQSEYISVLSDDDGMRMDALEDVLKNGAGKFIYALPNFQNP